MFIIKTKKQIIGGTLILFIGISVGVFLKLSPIANVFSVGKEVKTVVVDAGHGMPDGGAVGHSGTIEQEINLKIAKKTQEVLNGKGFLTVMTRKDEDSPEKDDKLSIREIKKRDMRKRKELIKKSDADLFISIHMNSFPNERVSGLRLFYSANHPGISELAEQIQKSISEITGAKTYAVKTADEGLFLMKNPPAPAILIECGFISNPEEEKKLKDEEYQAEIAWAIADAIDNYY